MSAIAAVLAAAAGGMVLGVAGFGWARKRRRSPGDLGCLPAETRHVIDLIRRAHDADAVCVTAQDGDPVFSRAAPPPPPELIERTVMLASLALAECREHVVKEDNVIVAFGDGHVGAAVLFATPVEADVVRTASADIRRMLGEFAVARKSGDVDSQEPPPMPEWLTPDTIEGIGGALCEAARRITPIMGRTMDLYAARHRSMTDELTGQPNKRALVQAMRDHDTRPCSLLRVYVDQLDELAPPAATAALRHVARIFRKSLRDYDVPARVGDEDFALFLPDTPFHHAFEVADRVRIAVSEEIFDWAGGEHLLTCSFGVASVPEASATPEGLLEAASLALGCARRDGRNRISSAQSRLN